MPRMTIDAVMHQAPFYAMTAMGTDDLVFGSDDTVWQLRFDPLRIPDLETDEDFEEPIETQDSYTKQQQHSW